MNGLAFKLQQQKFAGEYMQLYAPEIYFQEQE